MQMHADFCWKLCIFVKSMYFLHYLMKFFEFIIFFYFERFRLIVIHCNRSHDTQPYEFVLKIMLLGETFVFLTLFDAILWICDLKKKYLFNFENLAWDLGLIVYSIRTCHITHNHMNFYVFYQ